MRLASQFALLDQSRFIEVEHLEAALAIWDHSAQSLRFIFKADVDKNAEKVLAALKGAPEGLTKNQIMEGVFKKHLTGTALDELLTRLLAYRLIVQRDPPQGVRGRPGPRYHWNPW
jgi:hypothetical protein